MCTVTSTVECHYGAPPRTPFAASRRSPQGETRDCGGKQRIHMLLVTSRRFPLWWLAPPPSPPLCCGTMGAGQGCQFACGAATERNRTTGPVARWKCTPFGANAPPFPRWGTLLYASLCANLSCSLHSAAREALIKSLSDFILAFLFNARNKSTRIASYLRRLMTQHWIKIHMKFNSAN